MPNSSCGSPSDEPCANPDLVMFSARGLVPAPGALAVFYQSLGGTVKFVGKPHAPIFAAALERLGNPVPERVLVVGDWSTMTSLAGVRQKCRPRSSGLGFIEMHWRRLPICRARSGHLPARNPARRIGQLKIWSGEVSKMQRLAILNELRRMSARVGKNILRHRLLAAIPRLSKATCSG